MKNDLLYENLVADIIEKIPGRVKMTNEFVDLLMLEF